LLELPSKDRLEVEPSKEELNNKRDYKQMPNLTKQIHKKKIFIAFNAVFILEFFKSNQLIGHIKPLSNFFYFNSFLYWG